MSYNVTNLRNIYNVFGEEQTKEKLNNFQCTLNPDIEVFLKNRAIEFSKRSIAETFIVSTKYNNKEVIVGYFSLTYKTIKIRKDTFKGKMKSRLLRFAEFDNDRNYYLIPIPLIGQLSKNYYLNYNNLIEGNQLLRLALDKVKQVQKIIGGRFVFIECADNPKLRKFYENNGFRYFAQRKLDRDERKYNVGENLLQMICDLSNYST